ncbi:MAG: sucrose-phosphate synthase [Melioribacteraceae bacterium]|nr:MAG: sucrose-phosphate synthase [Melioribacteraceae bacterium]
MRNKKGLYIQLYNIHGLIRGNNLELGVDADTGGQTKYVLELAESLSKNPDVDKVEILTRLIKDKSLSDDYSVKNEVVNEKLSIVRIRCGGQKYIRKELLWEHLEEFVDKSIKYLKSGKRLPDVVHSHYADAGYVCTQLTRLLGVPMIHTGHSHGRLKRENLITDGMSVEDIEKRYKISTRIDAEEMALSYADRIIASTNHEKDHQYAFYKNVDYKKFVILPPGVDLEKFYPYIQSREWTGENSQLRSNIRDELLKFFTNINKPLILSLCRPEKRKNISGLIKAYGENKELQERANLAIFAGIRKDIQKMPDIEKDVLTEMLLLMDKYNLYGKMAIPKKHDFEYEVPELYRIAADTQGVFVNSAFHENFGLTLIEAASTGLPIVSTKVGGPHDIINNLENGRLVDVKDSANIAKGILDLITNEKIWNDCSRNGINRINNYYSWDAHTSKYLETIYNVLEQQESNPKTFISTGKRLFDYNRLIMLDIDETITGDPDGIAALSKLLEDRPADAGFGVATGRNVNLAINILSEIGFIKPDLIVSSVGSEIYYYDGKEYSYSTSWAAHIKNSWKPDRIEGLMRNFDFLEKQEEDNQRDFKLSYNNLGTLKDLEQVKKILSEKRIKTNLIISHGTYVDFLPYRASKGRAIRYLSYRWNIPHDKILVGGDSGNDEDMLTGELLGVVVANHSPELAKLKGRRRIYFSDKKYANGVIDGIKHYDFC